MRITSMRDLLAAHPFFDGLAEPHLAVVAACGRNVRLPAGTRVFDEGGPADTFYVIRRGRVAVETHRPGKRSVVISTMGDGDLVGWSWLIPPYRWHFDARAVEDTAAVALDGVCLRRKCDEDPQLGYDLMQRFTGLMVQNLQDTRMQLLDLYGGSEHEDDARD
jgi:CRP/FNR family transcriptional regulator, cyclic AMP receptor protein